MSERKNTIKLHGGQHANYLYVVRDSLNRVQDYAVGRPVECPAWDTNTQFRIDFINDLIAGNVNIGNEPPSGWVVYKLKNGGSTLIPAGTFIGHRAEFIDYAVGDNTGYKWYIYPMTESKMGNPIVTEEIVTDFDKWTLFVVDTTTTENTFTLKEVYYFDLNLEDITLTNNTEVSVITTFSKYMRLQKNPTNCLSGTLTSLVGYVDCATGKYVDTFEATDAVFRLSTSTNTKFLRDLQGRFICVDISAPVTMTQTLAGMQSVNKVSLSWTEVADASMAMVVDSI